MDLADTSTRDALAARLGERYAGRPVLVGPMVLAGATGAVRWFRALGCPVLVVSTNRGAGEVPAPEECTVVPLEVPSYATVTDELRAHDRLARSLPPAVAAAVEAFDPDRRGTWFTSPFVTTDRPVLGRPVTGGRPAAFLALEDKLLADGVWAAAGVAHVPHRVVPLDAAALGSASAELAGPLGAVWSGDARDGFNGGGNFVRWVDDERSRAAALAWFAPRCDRVRVMPFLEGVPCSVHGLVLPDGTAVLRPVEIAMLRDPVARRFVYAGLGTVWDPPDADRDEMRAAARRVGEHLRAAHSYRGFFGIDGVLTADGFRPTELNTRLSAGVGVVGSVDLRLLTLLQSALVAGDDPGVTVGDVESLLPVMDAHRSGRVAAFAEGRSIGEVSYPVSFDGHDLARADHETGSRLVAADTPTGFFAKIDPCALLGGARRLADLNLALLRHLDREHGGGFGDLAAAPDVRVRAGPG